MVFWILPKCLKHSGTHGSLLVLNVASLNMVSEMQLRFRTCIGDGAIKSRVAACQAEQDSSVKSSTSQGGFQEFSQRKEFESKSTISKQSVPTMLQILHNHCEEN